MLFLVFGVVLGQHAKTKKHFLVFGVVLGQHAKTKKQAWSIRDVASP